MTANFSIIEYDDGYILIGDAYGLNRTLLDLLQKHEEESPKTVVFAVILAVLSYIANGIITGVVLASPTLRCNILYLHIVNFSVANFILSVFVVPLSIYAELKPWALGDEVCKAWIIMDVLLPFISFLILLLMNIDRLLVVTCSKKYPCLMKKPMKGLIIILPWLVGTILIIPLWVKGAKSLPHYEGHCVFSLVFAAAVTSPLLTYFIPAVLTIIIVTMVLIYNFRGNLQTDQMYSMPSRSVDYQQPESTNNTNFFEEKHLSLVSLCLADFFFIAMWFPYQLFTLLMSICENCYPPISAAVAFTWLGASTTCVIPILWLCDVNMRHNITRLIRNCCVRETKKDNDDSRNRLPLI